MSIKKRVLILSANPKDTTRLRLDEEVREITEGLKRSKYREQFIIHQVWAVRLRDLRRAMLDYEPHIVHFCGHSREQGLMVEDEHGHVISVNSTALSTLFERFTDQTECVLLNACYSEVQAEAINKYISYVIGMTKGINDKAAIEFAVGFYDALGAGKFIEDAFDFGRNAIQLYNLPEELTPKLKKNIELCGRQENKQKKTAWIEGSGDSTDTTPFPPNEKVYHNLPQTDYGQFIGREQEIVKIKQILRPYPYSQYPIVTIDGIGGVGKSTLALEIAHYYLHNYTSLSNEERFDAIIWVSAKQTLLTGDGIIKRTQVLRTLDDIYNAIAIALKRNDITQVRFEEQAGVVRNALTHQRTLLIVDNLETVDDEAVMAFLREVPAPTKVIVTTRHRFDVAYPIRLTGMAWENAKWLIKQECEKKGIGYPPDKMDESAILDENEMYRLFERTGGIPLAIVWSIAQMGFGYSVDSVLMRLGQPTSDIAKFCYDASLEYIKSKSSYNLLLALSLFATSASRKALERMTDLPILDCDDGLVELEKLSLVNKHSNHFSLLPLTKLYVEAEISKYPGLYHQFTDRLQFYFLDFLTEHNENKYETLKQVTAELENIQFAIEKCLRNDQKNIFISFVDKMEFYMRVTGMWALSTKYLELGIKCAIAVEHRSLKAKFFSSLATIKNLQGDSDGAEKLIQQAIPLFRKIGDNKSGLALSLWRLASIYIERGAYEDAKKLLYEALDIAIEIEDKERIAFTKIKLAQIEIDKGNYDSGEILLKEAESVREGEIQLSDDLAYTYYLLGRVSVLQKRYDLAEQYLKKAQNIGEELSSQLYITRANKGLAELNFAIGRIDEAKETATQVIEVLNKLGLQRELREAQKLLEKIATQ